MNKSEYRLKKIINGRGYVAEIQCKLLEERIHSKCQIDILFDTSIDLKWQQYLKLGASLIEYHYSFIASKYLKINVASITAFPMDTTPIMIIYALIHAVGELIGINPKEIVYLDEQSGNFNFLR